MNPLLLSTALLAAEPAKPAAEQPAAFDLLVSASSAPFQRASSPLRWGRQHMAAAGQPKPPPRQGAQPPGTHPRRQSRAVPPQEAQPEHVHVAGCSSSPDGHSTGACGFNPLDKPCRNVGAAGAVVAGLHGGAGAWWAASLLLWKRHATRGSRPQAGLRTGPPLPGAPEQGCQSGAFGTRAACCPRAWWWPAAAALGPQPGHGQRQRRPAAGTRRPPQGRAARPGCLAASRV